LKELETYSAYPPLQDPASYDLSQVYNQIKQARLPVAATNRKGQSHCRPREEAAGRKRRPLVAEHREI